MILNAAFENISLKKYMNNKQSVREDHRNIHLKQTFPAIIKAVTLGFCEAVFTLRKKFMKQLI